jgi:hypothetical protein
MEISLFYSIPIWASALLFLIGLLLALELGFRVGLARRGKWKDADSGGGAIVQSSMFALLGLVLAFTYASSISRLDARKLAIPLESNALGTAFQRADFVADPGRTELKKVLLDYARTRVFPPETQQSTENRSEAIARTLQQQSRIWPVVKDVVEQNNSEPMEASLVAALNAVFDAHTIRLAASLDTLPKIVMWMLLFVAAASLSVAGFNAGIQGLMSRWRMTALTLVLTGLMTLIIDFDRPLFGLVIVDQQILDTVVKEMESDLHGVASTP